MEVETPATHRSRTRGILAAAALVLALVPILIGALAISASGVPTRTASPLSFTPLSLQTSNSSTAHPALSVLPPGRGAVVALIRHPTTLRTAPGGRRISPLGLRTSFGSPSTALVVRTSGSWLGVVSPLAGNNRLGWIPRSAASLSRISWELRVSLAARRLTILNGGRAVARFTVAIGRPTAPTPTGRFAVTDRLLTGDPSGPYGCCILALSAISPHAIQGWNGGNRIAIHSTPETSSIGEPVSHGCVRVTVAEGQWLINHIPLGTPTLISS